MDPDALGTMLVPEYDTRNNNVVYRDPDTPEMNGLRRVKSYWGVDPNIVQYDIVVHTSIPDSVGDVLTVHWFPRTERFAFKNLNNGFSFENPAQQLCLYVARDAHDDTNHATLMRYDPATHTYTTMVGVVVGIRVHTLALFAPGSASWFAEQVTAKTSSSIVLPPRMPEQCHMLSQNLPHSPYHQPPHVRHLVQRCDKERITSPTPFLNHTRPDDTAIGGSDLAQYHSALRSNLSNREESGSLTFSTASSSSSVCCSTTSTDTSTQPTTTSAITHATASLRPVSPLLTTPAQEVANRNKLL